MFGQKEKLVAGAMSFYHDDGLVATWKQAAEFAGSGRLGTMPDVTMARANSSMDDNVWNTYYTTLSAEYLGYSRQGNRILIIAHGIGPMATLDGVLKAYSWEFKDKTRSNDGGRITQQEFWDLEDGKYGEVAIVDFEDYCSRYKYPFLEFIRFSQALKDPLLFARLGAQTEQLLLKHSAYAKNWHQEQAGIEPENKYDSPNFSKYVARRKQLHEENSHQDSDPIIIRLQGATNCCYTFGPEHGHRPIEPGMALAHLLSTGRLCHMHHDGQESLVFDVSCHEWHDGTRLIGIKKDSSLITGVNSGPNARKLLAKHWQDLFLPVRFPRPVVFRALMKIQDQWFTQYPKKGAAMDSWEPEYLVTRVETIGQPVEFRTEIGGGYHGFFRFSTKEVQNLALPGANAYFFVSEPTCEWHGGNPTHHVAMVQFYKIQADTRRRLMRADQLKNDYALMISLLAKEQKVA